MTHSISNHPIKIDQIADILHANKRLILSEQSIDKIKACRLYLDKIIEQSESPVYGINTGFGSLCNVKIDANQLEQLQHNLLLSHACGCGDEVPSEIVKIMLLLKIQSLSYGHSAVSIETVEALLHMYNEDILPVVYEQGSLGASGDLAPLAHLCIPLLGEGKVRVSGKIIESKNVTIPKIQLQSKEGLALLNGTQFMSAYGVYILQKTKQILSWADHIAAISLEAFNGRIEPFNKLIHQVRPHQGQLQTAALLTHLLQGSEMIIADNKAVQDPYSFRCIPQVHGASKDVYAHVMHVFETEINSVTDNPNVFPDEDIILSGGNFHGQCLSMALDYLAIALAEIGNISERRTYQLISGSRDLPPFLVKNPGLHSGMMIPQYTAASIVSANKQLCSPASIDSIPSSNGQEDHVSMGANAATKCLRVLNNVERIIAIELLNATQAIEFRRPKKTGIVLEKVIEAYRTHVPFIDCDRYLHQDIQSSILFIRNNTSLLQA